MGPSLLKLIKLLPFKNESTCARVYSNPLGTRPPDRSCSAGTNTPRGLLFFCSKNERTCPNSQRIRNGSRQHVHPVYGHLAPNHAILDTSQRIRVCRLIDCCRRLGPTDSAKFVVAPARVTKILIFIGMTIS